VSHPSFSHQDLSSLSIIGSDLLDAAIVHDEVDGASQGIKVP